MKICLIDELQHLLDFVWQVELAALRRKKPVLEPLHLAFMRRAWRHGHVSYDRMQKDSGLSKVNISRAGRLLEQLGLAKVKPDPKDKRRRHLFLTKDGMQHFQEIESKLAQHVMQLIEAHENDSLRLLTFAIHLVYVNSLLPVTRVTNERTHLPSNISSKDRVNPGSKDAEIEIVLWPDVAPRAEDKQNRPR